MKFPLFCLTIVLIAETCRAGPLADLFGPIRRNEQASSVDIRIRSEGCEDPGKAEGTCGLAYIFVDGVDRSLHKRGHNVVIVDAATGEFLEAKAFDTHGDANAGNNLRDYLNSITGHKIVSVAIQDAGGEYVTPAMGALTRLGATAPIFKELRASFALIGYAGVAKQPWITQVQRNRGKGPSEVSAKIPLSTNTPQESPSVAIYIRSEGCEDLGKQKGTCGLAYMFVNGVDRSLHKRGHNVVVVDAATGKFLEAKVFDTHGDAAAGNNLRDYLNSITGNKIVLVAIQDAGGEYVTPAMGALTRLGATAPIFKELRASFALIGYAGAAKQSWSTQEQRNRGKGPSEVSANVPLSQNPPQSQSVAVYIRSEGCEDPGKQKDTCGLGFIFVNGVDRSLHKRGHNVVLVDAETGKFIEAKAFDTHGDNKAGNNLRDYLNSIRGHKIVLVALQDAGAEYVSPAMGALTRLGASGPIWRELRGSFALIGYAGVAKQSWIAQEQQNRGKGPSEVSASIPLSKSPPAEGPSMAIYIQSEGCNDPGKTKDTCGIAYIFVNGVDRSLHNRGHNVVILDAATGQFREAKGFDTHGNAAAGNSLRDYLNSITGDKIVLVSVQDEGGKYMSPAIDALKRLGATDPILTEFRGSFALVGYAGITKPSWISQDWQKSGEGPSVIKMKILLPRDGGWSDFGDWGECSVSCGGGIQERTRTCTNPPRAHGGKDCDGDSKEERECNTEACPVEKVDGGWSDWVPYGPCKTKKKPKCGGKGRQRAKRTCTNPKPSGGGAGCKGKAKGKVKCNLPAC